MPSTRSPQLCRLALAVLAAFASSAAMLHAASAQTPAPSVPAGSVATSAFVDVYTLTRPGADATQTMTLRLRADGIASLRIEYSITQTAAGTPVTPLFETGTWRESDGLAAVHLDTVASLVGKIPSNMHRTSVDLSFALTGCVLKLVADPAHEYGTSGLVFGKKTCGN